MTWFLWFRVANTSPALIRRVPEGFFCGPLYGIALALFIYLTAPDTAGQPYPATGRYSRSFPIRGYAAGEGSALTARNDERDLPGRKPVAKKLGTGSAVVPVSRQRLPALALHRERTLAWKSPGRH